MLDKKERKEQAIQKVSRITGLNPHVIRIWEKRYGAVIPERTGTNRRFYSDESIERLQLLGYLTRKGQRIGQVARLSLAELKSLVENLEEKKATPQAPDNTDEIFQSCLQSIGLFEAQELDILLAKSTIFMAPVVVIENLITPLLKEIHQRVRTGQLRLAHERFTQMAIRSFLLNFMKSYEVPTHAPQIIVTSLIGQHDEMGALYSLSAASSQGWRALYLGPNLPIEEIAATAHQLKTPAILLHFNQPRQDPRLLGELQNLKKLLPPETCLIATGSDLSFYQAILDKVGAVSVSSFSILLETLNRLNQY